MGVGARDKIDRMLVQRYSKEKVNNPEDATVLAITRDRYWEIMKDVAQVHMAMVKATTIVKKGIAGDKATPAKSQA